MVIVLLMLGGIAILLSLSGKLLIGVVVYWCVVIVAAICVIIVYSRCRWSIGVVWTVGACS